MRDVSHAVVPLITVGIIGTIVTAILGFFWAPAVDSNSWNAPEAYRIIYWHVPFAWVSFLAFAILFLGSIFWYAKRSDFGWVMAPYELVGSHFNGHTCFLYESVPNHPEPDRLWKMISDTKITHLGLSPTAVRVLIGEGDHWVEKHDLSTLRVLGSTGEPWDIESYLWYFDKVGAKKCPIMNISGGTEIGACILQPLPVMELTPCTLGAPAMGTDADVFDDQGNPVRNEVGHLVLKQPIPSLTMGFLNDSDRYLETYFSRWNKFSKSSFIFWYQLISQTYISKSSACHYSVIPAA